MCECYMRLKTEAKGSYLLTGPDGNCAYYPRVWPGPRRYLMAFNHRVNMEALGRANLQKKGLKWKVFSVVGIFVFCLAPGHGHSLTASPRLSTSCIFHADDRSRATAKYTTLTYVFMHVWLVGGMMHAFWLRKQYVRAAEKGITVMGNYQGFQYSCMYQTYIRFILWVRQEQVP